MQSFHHPGCTRADLGPGALPYREPVRGLGPCAGMTFRVADSMGLLCSAEVCVSYDTRPIPHCVCSGREGGGSHVITMGQLQDETAGCGRPMPTIEADPALSLLCVSKALFSPVPG